MPAPTTDRRPAPSPWRSHPAHPACAEARTSPARSPHSSLIIHRSASLLLLLALAAAGCAPKSPSPSRAEAPRAQAPISNTDPCAMRLHDLCAPLLLYYSMNDSLPGRLDDLRQVPGFENQVVLTCPVSNRPYVYNPVGVYNPNQPERVILYDPTPAHSGFRWAISIIEPQQPNAPLITKVIALPESQFHLTLPR